MVLLRCEKLTIKRQSKLGEFPELKKVVENHNKNMDKFHEFLEEERKKEDQGE